MLRPDRSVFSADTLNQGCEAYVEYCYTTHADPQTRVGTKCGHELHIVQNSAVRHRNIAAILITLELVPCRLLAILFAVYAALMLFYSLTTFRALRTSPYHAFRTGEPCVACALCGVTCKLQILTASIRMHRQHDCANPGMLLPAYLQLPACMACCTAPRTGMRQPSC
jgi:hypothetical protein